jgi:hypothetical protein
MMNNNKILTVSYGTFSCTLEGFDDSFGTMKAIAEYFRDLASDDRYFGAEPPQPDAEMLTRIAEREISRRVQAREHDGRIVLSATDGDAQAAVTDPEVKAPEEPTDNAVDVDVVAQPDPVTETAPDPEIIAEPDVVADVETVEPSVSAIDDSSESKAVETEQDTVEDAVETETDQADEFFAATTEGDDADVVEETPVAIAEDLADANASDPKADDSIAAKLQRIRAVVSQGQQDSATEELFEDEHADEFAPKRELPDIADAVSDVTTTPSEVISDAARDVQEAMTLDDAAQDADVAEDEEEDDVAAILARLDSETSARDVIADQIEDTKQDDSGLDGLAALMAEDRGLDENEEVDENLFEDAQAPKPVDAPPRARIIKVKRTEIDAAIASGALEEVEDQVDGAAAEIENVVASSLSDQEEAELLAELAQVEAETAGTAIEQSLADDAQNEAHPTDIRDAAILESEAVAPKNVNDDDVSRLMAEADNQMEEPEGSDRRNAFAHLKAAVIAKKADADIGNDSLQDEGAFRTDLASVVKPRRPAVTSGRAERPEGKRPAPLRLVAEQRVDIDDTPKEPVRPRRVAAEEDTAQDAADTGNFADYASDLGAHNLPALLEAAASYLSFVEGRDEFSRPQLMSKVRQVELGEFSREDGLRSFGQLLRSGKIEKIKGGRFAVTGDIGYRPDHRAAG